MYNINNCDRVFMENYSNVEFDYQLGFWKYIWPSQVPGKVRSFIWRATTKCLPTMLALRSKHVEVSTRCPVCNGNPEDTVHALVKCPHARSV